MTIVSNTSPLCYLTLIGHAEILPRLYGTVHITQKVLDELRHPDAPRSVRDWANTPPDWLKFIPVRKSPIRHWLRLTPARAPHCDCPSNSAPMWCCLMKLPLVPSRFNAA